MVRHFIDVVDITAGELNLLLNQTEDIKKHPKDYSEKLTGKTLLMLFEKPSLRTRVSFEVGMTQLGGHAIYYDLATSPMGKKESVADTAKVASRYVDIVMARLFSHEQIQEFAKNSTVPVINALTDFSHPCQILSDLFTIREKKGKLKGLKLAYLGDCNNNVTHSLLQGCAMVGISISVACPNAREYLPNENVVKQAEGLGRASGAKVRVTHNPREAVGGADIVYTDSWMSYHIPKEKMEERVKALSPYQVNAALMKSAKPDAIFMNCLPAMRGMEQTADVIDGKQSVVFDQAENRLHAQKALMLWLLSQPR